MYTDNTQDFKELPDKDSNLSIVANAKGTIPTDAKTLHQIYLLIVGTTFKKLIEAIRAEPDEIKKKVLKARLKAFCVAGLFAVRNEKGLRIYAGLVHADVDKLTPAQMVAFGEILRNAPFIAFFFISPSGKGYKIFAWVSTPAEQHLQAWTQFNKYVSDLLGIATDPAPKSIASICFFSHDPEAFYNENVGVFEAKRTKQVLSLMRDFGLIETDEVTENESLDNYILEKTNEVIDSFNPDEPRHPQIAKTKFVFGLLKQYPQNTVSEEVYNMFYDAMGTHLYVDEVEAKTQNAYKSLAEAREKAEPVKSKTLERLLHIEATVSNKEYRDKFRIDVNEVIAPPQIAWSLFDPLTGTYAILGTLGNFSLITGKAKAKKSFLISMAVAIALVNDLLHGIFKSSLPPGQNEVLYFDTEQSKYHVQLAVRRVCSQAKTAEPPNLHAFHLRSLPPNERLQFIENEIYSSEKIGFVVIDGIKDCITSINDEQEASMIASKLLKWTEERNIHIVTVLHQNKGDTNARGHLGTELINKAETVLSVTVLEHDKEISIVQAEQCRNREPEPFAFNIDDDGIPQILLDYETAKPRAEKTNNIYTMENDQLQEIIFDAFSTETAIKYAELVRRVKLSYNKVTGLSIGDNKAREVISICKINSLIEQKAEREPYTLLDDLN
ncbi:BT4734/BF3469 family protein [Flavobacterium sp.]|uniref:BT4734/BF3469 family protein n=1 Tax=Flavobacterium sp. TaxID=239 RepID=UPI002CD1B0DB|nr:BT4734/BF3469 family protein [Flavobacterium sp.]HSD06965.1 BT4734/BF3469 family protein [Flavobacterium sp.]